MNNLHPLFRNILSGYWRPESVEVRTYQNEGQPATEILFDGTPIRFSILLTDEQVQKYLELRGKAQQQEELMREREEHFRD